MNYPSLSLKQDLIDKVFSGAKYEIQKQSEQSASPGSIRFKKYKQIALRLQNGVVEECDQCEYKTSKYMAMYRHKRENHLVLKQKCTDCDFSNIYPNKVKTHYNQVHMGIKRKKTVKAKKCRSESCEYAGTTNCIESESHSMYFCKQCQKSFKSSHSMKFHTEKIHEGLVFNSRLKHIKCRRNLCEYAGTKNCLDLRSHSRFQCEYCQLSYGRSDDLKLHIGKIHEGLIFNCDFCDTYSTARRTDLKKHIFHKHSVEKSNQIKSKLRCHVVNCNFRTPWNQNLRRHAKVHLAKSSKIDIKQSVLINCCQEGCDAKVVNIKKHMKVHSRGAINICKSNDCNFETFIRYICQRI